MTDHRVILADCLGPEGLASLGDKSVDHVITDPPYSEKVHDSREVTKHLNGSAVLRIDFAPLTDEQAVALAREFARVARRWVLVFAADHSLNLWMAALEGAGLSYRRTMGWVKPDAMPQMSGDRPAQGFELIACAHAPGRSTWNGGGKVGVYHFNKSSSDPVRTGHPTQKPIALMEALVRDFTDEGETVLDPFAGSGTTGVACRRLGRRFIGFERDAKYHAIAEKRIANAREQLGLWGGAA